MRGGFAWCRIIRANQPRAFRDRRKLSDREADLDMHENIAGSKPAEAERLVKLFAKECRAKRGVLLLAASSSRVRSAEPLVHADLGWVGGCCRCRE